MHSSLVRSCDEIITLAKLLNEQAKTERNDEDYDRANGLEMAAKALGYLAGGICTPAEALAKAIAEQAAEEFAAAVGEITND